MTSVRRWIRGDGKPVRQQVSITAVQTTLNKLGKYFQKEASNSPKNQGQGGDEDTRRELFARKNLHPVTQIISNTLS